MQYDFTNEWFVPYMPIWRRLFDWLKPSRILEIGSYEGRSTTFMIEQIGKYRDGSLHCIDTWSGSLEHYGSDMAAIERRFDANVNIALRNASNNVLVHKHKRSSTDALPHLLTSGFGESFDIIYVDGSHQCSQVLFDAVNSYHLLRDGGVIIFDDYLWQMELDGKRNHFDLPKPAIDAFVNLNRATLRPIVAPLYQVYLRKDANGVFDPLIDLFDIFLSNK